MNVIITLSMTDDQLMVINLQNLFRLLLITQRQN